MLLRKELSRAKDRHLRNVVLYYIRQAVAKRDFATADDLSFMEINDAEFGLAQLITEGTIELLPENNQSSGFHRIVRGPNWSRYAGSRYVD